MRSTKSLQFVLWCIILSLQTTSCQGLSHLNPLGGGDTLVIEHKHKHLLMEFDQVPRYYSETYELDWPVSLGDRDVSDLQNYLMANIIALEAQDENIDDYINYIPEGGQVVAEFPPHAWDDISNYYEHITRLTCEQVPGRFAVLTIKMHESSLGMPHTTDSEEEIAERLYVCYDLTNNSFVMLNDLFLPEHLDDLSDLCAEHLFDVSPAILANCEMEKDGSHLNVNYGQLVLSPGHIGLEFGNALEGYQLVDLAVEDVAEWLTSYGQKLMDVKAPKDDDNQYITLSDCPTTDNAITFTTTKTPDEYPCYKTITVTKRGHEPQTFDIERFQCSDDQPLVHFVDANFDGHTDLYLGTGEDRTFNNILLWDDDAEKFVQVFPEVANNLPIPLFCKQSKCILSSGSSSAWTWNISEYKPQGNTLVESEWLATTTPYINEGYSGWDEGEEYLYILRKGGEDGPIIARCNICTQLPEHWQKLIKADRKNMARYRISDLQE